MDTHIQCACGWSGDRAHLRAGACPSCMRPQGVPYAYPPLPSWHQAPASMHPASPVTRSASSAWCAGGCRGPRWVSLLLMFALVGASVAAIGGMTRRGCPARHDRITAKPHKQQDRPGDETGMREWRLTSPDARQRELQNKYGNAPRVEPRPQGSISPGRKYEDATCEPAPKSR